MVVLMLFVLMVIGVIIIASKSYKANQLRFEEAEKSRLRAGGKPVAVGVPDLEPGNLLSEDKEPYLPKITPRGDP